MPTLFPAVPSPDAPVPGGLLHAASTRQSEVQIHDLLDQVAGDLDILAAVIEAFIECRHDQILALEWAVQSGNAESVAIAAHTISGSLRNLCAGPAAAIAAGIEVAARDGRARGHELQVSELGRRLHAIEAELLQVLARSSDGQVLP